ncbi:MAG: TetR family transcriptional regulator [Mycobacterium sp.]|nr:TetR family transcriptional regulator [Mycobacterium sp.]
MTTTLPVGVPARPLRRDAAENRQRILAAAATVFAEHGLDAGVEEVARAAGVGMGTLYRRFPTKDALVTELVVELLSEVADEARSALAHADGRGLHRFLRATAERQAAHRGCLPRLWDESGAEGLALEIRGLIAELLADAQAHGEVRSELSVTDISVLLWAVRGVIETGREAAPEAWRRHLSVVLLGLAPSPEPLDGEPLSAEQVGRVGKARRAVT